MNTLCRCGHEKIAHNLPYGASENTCDRCKCLSFQPSTIASKEETIGGFIKDIESCDLTPAPKEDCGCVEIGMGKIPKYCPKHLKENLDPVPSSPNKTISETIKAFGGCTSCYGKGYSTVAFSEQWGGDFLGDKAGSTPMRNNVVPCKKCSRGEEIKRILAESHAAGVKEFRKKAIDAGEHLMMRGDWSKEYTDAYFDGIEAYQKTLKSLTPNNE